MCQWFSLLLWSSVYEPYRYCRCLLLAATPTASYFFVCQFMWLWSYWSWWRVTNYIPDSFETPLLVNRSLHFSIFQQIRKLKTCFFIHNCVAHIFALKKIITLFKIEFNKHLNNNNNNNNNNVRCSFRNIGCLWVLSTSVYQLPGTLVHSSFYPLLGWPIFSSYS